MKRAFFQSLILLLLGLFLFAGCTPESTQSPTEAAPTTENTPISEPTTAPQPTALPTALVLPDGIAQVELPDTASETAAALFAAAHPPRDNYALAESLLGISPDLFVSATSLTGPPQVNETVNFQVARFPGSNDIKMLPARLRFQTDHVNWWVDVTTTLVDDDELEAAAEYFEEQILPSNRLIFGTEAAPGIDQDNRIHFLILEGGESWGGFFGYFGSYNQYPQAIVQKSNEREMLVINISAFSPKSETFPGKLAHEYQHLIQWNRDINEDLWLNEAFSELAYYFSGASVAIVRGASNAGYFSENPFIQLTSRPERRYGEEDKSSFMHYGAEKAFAIYLFEQFGPEFMQNLVSNEEPGVISIQQELDKLPTSPRFRDVYANWLVANLLIQPNLAEGQFGYREYAPTRPVRELVNSFRGVPIEDQLPPYGGQYYEVVNEAGNPVSVSFQGSNAARVTSADPASGQYAWYSSRGDNSDFTLTRAFDLTGVASATLEYEVWFELEDFYDYGYVEVSTDAGATWDILTTANGTDQNPHDLAYGFGYTGGSIDWLPEALDLTPYAGAEILVRFQVLTDFSTNRDGMQVDNIAIPEIGFFDGAEDEGGGWDAQGFIRSTNIVPVEWVIWLIELTSPTRVTRILTDELGAAEFLIEVFPTGSPFAALIVSPTAPVTTMELDYELIFQNP